MATRKKPTPPLQQGLLSAIGERPEDDVPRLVYADWLQEQGQAERGEFIRAQVVLARLAPGDSSREELEDREAALLAAHRGEWLANVPAWALGLIDFQRGFPSVVAIDTKDLGRLLARFRPDVPLESLTLTVGREEALNLPAELASVRPRRLCVRGGRLQAEGVRELVRSGLLAQVEELEFRQCLDEQALPALVEAAPIERLRRFRSSSNYFGDEGIILLAGWPALASVQSLDLSDSGAGPAGVEALARSPHLGDVTSLNLSGNSLEVAGARTLASSQLLSQLRDLNLNGNAISDDGLEALAQSPQGNLTRLHLGANQIEVEGMQALASWAQLPLLEELTLTDNPLRRAGLRALLAGRADQLRVLGLRYCELGARGAQALAASANLPALASLDLTGNELMHDGIQALVSAPLARRLTRLVLGTNQLGGETYQAIASANLENLVSLDLSYGYGRAEYLAPCSRLLSCRASALSSWPTVPSGTGTSCHWRAPPCWPG